MIRHITGNVETSTPSHKAARPSVVMFVPLVELVNSDHWTAMKKIHFCVYFAEFHAFSPCKTRSKVPDWAHLSVFKVKVWNRVQKFRTEHSFRLHPVSYLNFENWRNRSRNHLWPTIGCRTVLSIQKLAIHLLNPYLFMGRWGLTIRLRKGESCPESSINI